MIMPVPPPSSPLFLSSHMHTDKHRLVTGFIISLPHSSDAGHKSMTLSPDLLSFTCLPLCTQTQLHGQRHNSSVYWSHFI